MKKMVKGEITAFLSLVFLLLLTLVGALLESASIQLAKNERRADAGRAVESAFAEYQKDLLERYGIFAIEGSYESGTMSEENILNRLSFYGAENIETEIAPIVGSEEQAKDLIAYIKSNNSGEESIWQTNIFGKSIGQLVEDGIHRKLIQISDESQVKLQDTMQKIVNDSKGGLVCIII